MNSRQMNELIAKAEVLVEALLICRPFPANILW